eukprot:CAMPEP_0197050700 /NCGR_PEP_ID=MMETSP1384-20130603/25539_1 /TAXON_ID=29189 /ORGANISM="Ammonia sp." /LENGTH=224 /DNA_ID=CAMNT_0042483145 /DNA_START=62 /DNA_END=736 /DNA_ORIENTATION=+
MGSSVSPSESAEATNSSQIGGARSSSSRSSNIDFFENGLQNLIDHALLPAKCIPFDWYVYRHKKSILNGEIPHERVILECEEYIFCVELGSAGGGVGGVVGADWRVIANLVDESESTDDCRATWIEHETANFSLEHLIFYVKSVMDVTGNYNVATQNCQTFARRLVRELGKEVKGLEDGTKGIIASAVTSSALIVSASLAAAARGGANADFGSPIELDFLDRDD